MQVGGSAKCFEESVRIVVECGGVEEDGKD